MKYAAILLLGAIISFILMLLYIFFVELKLKETRNMLVTIVDTEPSNSFRSFKIIVDIHGEKHKIYISKRCNEKPNLIGSDTIITREIYEYSSGAETGIRYIRFFNKSEYCE